MGKFFRRPGVYVSQIPTRPPTIARAPTSVTAFVGRTVDGPLLTSVPVRSVGEYDATFGGLSSDSPLSHAVRHYFAAGGSEAVIVRIPDAHAGAVNDGLSALGRFNLLCIPPHAFDSGADIEPSTWEAARVFCRQRRAFLLMDPPSHWTSADVVEEEIGRYRGTDDDFAALYLPRVRMPDSLAGNALAAFAPSGVVAGVIARTDSVRGVWKAPAGVDATLTGVVELEWDVDRAAIERISRLGVNILRTIPSHGRVVWGARTLAGQAGRVTEWTYVPVRRLALHVEESIRQGTKWAEMRANNAVLWAMLRGAVQDFLIGFHRDGALAGMKPEEAFFVRCGPDTTAPGDLADGVVDLLVGIAPLRPAEFIVLRIRISTADA